MVIERPRVGVGLLVIKKGQILLGKRKGSHGEGEYAGPGGHLELDETIKRCILRELKEEAGPELKIRDLEFLCFVNLRKYRPKHYGHIHMLAEWKSGKPVAMEPDMNEGWAWYSLDNLPQPLFGTMPEAIKAYQTGQKFFES